MGTFVPNPIYPGTPSGVGMFYPSRGSTLLNGLVSYWPLNEQSGQRNDVVGTNHLTDNNTVGSVNSGPEGTVASFVAGNSESLSATLIAPSSYTLSTWVKLDGGNNDLLHQGVVASVKNGVGGCLTYGSGHSSYGKAFANYAIYTADGAGWFLSGGWYGPAANTSPGWQNIVAVVDDSVKTISVFADGVQVGTSKSYTGIPGNFGVANAFIIGKQGSNPNPITDGSAWSPYVSGTGLWSRVLTVDERTAIYNAGVGKLYPFS